MAELILLLEVPVDVDDLVDATAKATQSVINEMMARDNASRFLEKDDLLVQSVGRAEPASLVT